MTMYLMSANDEVCCSAKWESDKIGDNQEQQLTTANFMRPRRTNPLVVTRGRLVFLASTVLSHSAVVPLAHLDNELQPARDRTVEQQPSGQALVGTS